MLRPGERIISERVELSNGSVSVRTYSEVVARTPTFDWTFWVSRLNEWQWLQSGTPWKNNALKVPRGLTWCADVLFNIMWYPLQPVWFGIKWIVAKVLDRVVPQTKWVTVTEQSGPSFTVEYEVESKEDQAFKQWAQDFVAALVDAGKDMLHLSFGHTFTPVLGERYLYAQKIGAYSEAQWVDPLNRRSASRKDIVSHVLGTKYKHADYRDPIIGEADNARGEQHVRCLWFLVKACRQAGIKMCVGIEDGFLDEEAKEEIWEKVGFPRVFSEWNRDANVCYFHAYFSDPENDDGESKLYSPLLLNEAKMAEVLLEAQGRPAVPKAIEVESAGGPGQDPSVNSAGPRA